MRKYVQYSMLMVTMGLMVSCGKSDTPESIAAKWCELNLKEHTAAIDSEKTSALAEKQAFEKEVDDKYFSETEFYASILNQMKDCEAALQSSSSETTDAESLLPLAYSDAATAANAYCELVDQSIAAAESNNEDEIKRIVSVKVIFEKNMDDSYKDNAERRDSIFKLVEPCMAKEVRFRSQ